MATFKTGLVFMATRIMNRRFIALQLWLSLQTFPMAAISKDAIPGREWFVHHRLFPVETHAGPGAIEDKVRRFGKAQLSSLRIGSFGEALCRGICRRGASTRNNATILIFEIIG